MFTLANSDLSGLALPVAGIVLLFLIVFLSGFKKPYDPDAKAKEEAEAKAAADAKKKKKRFSWTDEG